MKGIEGQEVIQSASPLNREDRELKKKKKKKPKNKYKELNLLQKKCLATSSEKTDQNTAQQLLENDSQKNIDESNASSASVQGKNRKQSKQELSNKRKSFENLDEAFEESVPCKKIKLLSDTEPGKVKDKIKTKTDCSAEMNLQTKKPILKQKLRPDKLKMVIENNSKVKSDNNDMSASPTNDGKVASKGSLKERMLQKLSAARFRYINENLYSMNGEEAEEMFKDDSDSFKAYHEGFSSQVEKWPVNPVDLMIKYINKRDEKLVVADLGCGEAKIAQMVKNKIVHSFDLVALNKHVTVCDISKLPLASKSVDICVFCLSLMGMNLVDYLCEASRVLKKNGILLIAEVLSRFEKVGAFVRKMKKMGFSLHEKNDSNKMFVWFEFQKVSELPSPQGLPQIELASCVYKKR